jgi:hypothetical protein
MFSCIGVLAVANIPSPAFARWTPFGVSRHCSPVKRYQISGPECVWTAFETAGFGRVPSR